MKLSKHSQPILGATMLDRNMCKLIGEFAGNDVHMRRGGEYYVLKSGRQTFVKTVYHDHTYRGILGQNRYVHVFEVKRRTPCSYVAQYKHSVIICHARLNKIFKFKTVFGELKGYIRRFFPNRKIDVQKYLQEYIELPFEDIPENVKIDYKHGDFILNLPPGFTEFTPVI